MHTSWGRVGQNIDDRKTEEFLNIIDAKKKFREIYRRQTLKRCYRLVDGHDGNSKKFLRENEQLINIPESNLNPAINNLMKILFDTDELRRVVLNYKLDVNILPLGVLTVDQIDRGIGILQCFHSALTNNMDPNSHGLQMLTEEFYRAVPHNFGVERPEPISTLNDTYRLYEMLSSMQKIKIAYEIIDNGTRNGKNILEFGYDNLNTEIIPVDHDSDVFRNVVKMTENTHGPTHRTRLTVEEVYSIARNEEIDRFKPFENDPNNRILWHGSKTCNFVGILRNGLRCAPKEAIITGNMFGRGNFDMQRKFIDFKKKIYFL